MKFLIVGQTPPPYGGQSINIARMIDTLKKNSINYKFIRMNFSEEMSENGSVSFKKIIKLFQLFININYNIIFNRPDFLYYPPSGSERVPVIRDIVLLFFARLFKVKIIFHFHAGGIASLYPELKGTIRLMFEKAFFFPEYSICLSSLGKSDPIFLKSHNISVIPNGVENIYRDSLQRNLSDKFIVLFIGVCRETKGILDFLEVVKQCNSINPLIIGRIIGKTFSAIEEKAIEEAVKEGYIEYYGVKTGNDKDALMFSSNVLLFPTFFEHENFPTVILEAFSCGIPAISTNWRGVPDQITNDYNGYVHEIHDYEGMKKSILYLFENPTRYEEICLNARNSYLMNYSLEKFENNIVNFFNSLK